MSKRFWFEALHEVRDGYYVEVGIDDDTPVALVTGKDLYSAIAYARTITRALNDEALKAMIVAIHDDNS